MDVAQRSLPRHLRAQVIKSLWQAWLQTRFLLFQRRRHNQLVLERIAGFPILVLEGVFNPTLFWTSEFLISLLDQRMLPPGATVLDMGTGSGIGAVAAAKLAGRVIAVDINPAATRCARINALLNEVEDRIEARHGDLFEPVPGERFDLILFNPPYFQGRPRDLLDGAFRATDVIERFVAALPDHLTPNGQALVILSSKGGIDTFLHECRVHGLKAAALANRQLVDETLVVYHCIVADRSGNTYVDSV